MVSSGTAGRRPTGRRCIPWCWPRSLRFFRDGKPLAWGIAVLHAALGAATVLLTALAARRWGLGPARVLLAAAIVALDPVLVAQSRMVMTETLAAFLLAASLAALGQPGRRGAALGGMALGPVGVVPAEHAAGGLAGGDRGPGHGPRSRGGRGSGGA